MTCIQIEFVIIIKKTYKKLTKAGAVHTKILFDVIATTISFIPPRSRFVEYIITESISNPVSCIDRYEKYIIVIVFDF